MPRRSLVLALALLTLAPLLPLGAGAGSATFGGVVRVDKAPGSASTEASLALDPADPNTVFTCSPSGVPSTTYHQSWFYVSHDAGAHWNYTRVETSATDTREYTYEGGDCDVAIGPDGTLYTADTWVGDLSVGHSFDGGKTWDGTAFALTSPIVDRPWLVAGPPGVLHVIHQDVQFGMPSVIWYARSSDHGRTFTPSVPVATATQDGAFTWEGPLVVSPSQQDLYVAYTRRPTAIVGFSSGPAPLLGEQVWIAASHDGGLTWGSHLISQRAKSASHLYPSLAMDEGGQLHVVFAQSTGSDQPIFYTTSADQGLTWSTPAPLGATGYGFAPWVAAKAPGTAFVYWYGTSDSNVDLGTTHSWYFHDAQVANAGTPTQTIALGTTTSTPIFTGAQGGEYEFSMVRLDANGLAHIAAMAQRPTGSTSAETMDYQVQTS